VALVRVGQDIGDDVMYIACLWQEIAMQAVKLTNILRPDNLASSIVWLAIKVFRTSARRVTLCAIFEISSIVIDSFIFLLC
jgi:hypothetical protein